MDDDMGRGARIRWPHRAGRIGAHSAVDMRNDPVFEALWADAGPDGIVRPNGGEGKMMSALSIDLETRDRVKLAGVMVAGAAVREDHAESVRRPCW